MSAADGRTNRAKVFRDWGPMFLVNGHSFAEITISGELRLTKGDVGTPTVLGAKDARLFALWLTSWFVDQP